jgi:hypothetical protein
MCKQRATQVIKDVGRGMMQARELATERSLGL